MESKPSTGCNTCLQVRIDEDIETHGCTAVARPWQCVIGGRGRRNCVLSVSRSRTKEILALSSQCEEWHLQVTIAYLTFLPRHCEFSLTPLEIAVHPHSIRAMAHALDSLPGSRTPDSPLVIILIEHRSISADMMHLLTPEF